MKIEIEIPEEFEADYNVNRFSDFFSRVRSDIDYNGICGNYERETADMLAEAFKNSKVVHTVDYRGGRLIDADRLIEKFKNKNIQIAFDLPVEEILGQDVDLDDFSMLMQDAIQAYKKMVIDTIRNQPTAYDVDAAVEQLEKEIEWYETYGCNNDLNRGIIGATRKAIGIVKGGGKVNG